jgi:hypothetical protein
MDTTTLIITNKINAPVDLVLRASTMLLNRRSVVGSELPMGTTLPTGTTLLCVADSGAVPAVPTQPRVSRDPRPTTIPAPRQDRIDGSVKGHQVAGMPAHLMSVHGKAATKFSTRLGRRTCRPPV